jgi:hypothetical protein
MTCETKNKWWLPMLEKEMEIKKVEENTRKY